MNTLARWFSLRPATFAAVGAGAVGIAGLVAVPNVVSAVNFAVGAVLASGLGWVGLNYLNGRPDPSVGEILYATENESTPASRSKGL